MAAPHEGARIKTAAARIVARLREIAGDRGDRAMFSRRASRMARIVHDRRSIQSCTSSSQHPAMLSPTQSP